MTGSRVVDWVRQWGDEVRITHYPKVDYEYEVDGAVYRANSPWPGMYAGPTRSVTGGRGWAERVAAGYPVGSTVTVYVEPANPAHAFLVPRASAKTAAVTLGVGAMLVLAAAVLGVAG